MLVPANWVMWATLRCIPSMCVAKPVWQRIKAATPPPNFRKFSIILGLHRTCLSEHSRIYKSAEPMPCRANTTKAKAAYQEFLTL